MQHPILLPVPKFLQIGESRFVLDEGTEIRLLPGCRDAEYNAARELAEAIKSYAECDLFIESEPQEPTGANEIILQILPLSGERMSEIGEPCVRDEYILTISRNQIRLAAGHSTGLFYAVQTLIQLLRQYGRLLPALRIHDEPDFPCRGFLLDVSRGRVPTLDHLKWLARTLSHFKINMLQLYVEHTFQFQFDPDIGAGCSPLTPDEICELDRYCQSRHIELVPCLQSFGHMGFILSLPKYRNLAEIVQFDNWWAATWRQRMRGMTLSPVRTDSYLLLRSLYAEFLPCFASPFFNLNADETWDLGKGLGRKQAERIGVGALYVKHIRRICAMARTFGRRPMIWADVIYHYPELLGKLREDIMFLDWGYNHDSPFARCKTMHDYGKPFFVCPGTSAWDQVFPDVWNATLNIRRFVAAGKEHGAHGVLNTDWGDCGHFNMPALSLHGAILGAAMAWNEGRPADDEAFDRAFSLHLFDDARGVIGRAIRRAGSLIRRKTGKDIKTWELWTMPLADAAVGREIPPSEVGPMIEAVRQALDAIGTCRPARERDPVSCAELTRGLLMFESLLLRAALEHRHCGAPHAYDEPGLTWNEWAQHAAMTLTGIETLWQLRSKPSNFEDIRQVFHKQIAKARATSTGTAL
ncbi:MAG: family 20 glycosylhydrolase [Candidatus Sumerlaeia bacterium]|nr:family 20 glycosylhydrolase [Candidatus Sumerlaeia bacterium]